MMWANASPANRGRHRQGEIHEKESYCDIRAGCVYRKSDSAILVMKAAKDGS